MEKFSEIKYVRPDGEAEIARKKAYVESLTKATSYEEMKQLYIAEMLEDRKFNHMAMVASVRNTVNTNDEFYAEEMKYISSVRPKLALVTIEANKALLNSPFRKDFEKEYGEFFTKNMEMKLKLSDECVVEDLIEEAALVQQYSKAVAVAETEFKGQKVNFYGLLKFMENPDREIRKEAMNAWGDLYASIADNLDEIYDKQVKLRAGMAKKLGFDSYIDFQYKNRGRYDYTADDVAKFRKQVKEVIVPVCAELRNRQAARLGVDKLKYYDEALIYADGNPTPIGTKDELVAKALAMYTDMSAETAEYFKYMTDHEMFDLETKPGKRGGGYCTFSAELKSPFIFSNFNGTLADVDVLTHEAGHGFEAYTACRNVPLDAMTHSTSEINEIHSMSMETFAYPYMESFFGDQADKYRYAHTVGALQVIPYMVCVDEYQHRVFENINLTAKERRAIWKSLEETYLPWRDYDGHPFLSEGGFWMQKQHIFMFPFYYIDYALAQMGAFEFYGKDKADHQAAWNGYVELCKAGGSKGYFDTLASAGLSNPFEEGTVKTIIDSLLPELLG